MIDAAIWLGGWSLFVAYALWAKADTTHLAGAVNRCVICRRKRQTMPYSDGWGARPLPHCASCIRDCEGVALEASA